MTIDSTNATSPASTCTKVDPDLIDNALADLEVATAFHEAACKFLDEMRSIALNHLGENPTLLHYAKQTDIMLAELEGRMTMQKPRLEKALTQALAAWRAPANAAALAGGEA